jgi:hypothetical protein
MRLFCLSICVFVCAVIAGGRFFTNAALADHKTVFYTLPRPGIGQKQDCYTDMYSQDLLRDLKLMHQMGVTTVMTYNPWSWGASHSVLLDKMAEYKMSLGLTFKADIKGNMRRNLEKLQKAVEDSKVKLEFVYLDYPLDFDNAEPFFRWVIQVRSWMKQFALDVPVLVRFFPEVTNTQTISYLLGQYDEGDFTAWVVEAYSTASMIQWETIQAKNQKKLFFKYGADSWNMVNKTTELYPQAKQLMTMVDRLGSGSSNATLSGAVLGYSDTWYLGNEIVYFQGQNDDLCPDKNPYLRTSCGGYDPAIEYGDVYWAVEHMGVMKAYETIWYTRCVDTTPAARGLQTKWNPGAQPLPATTCVFSNTVPHDYVLYLWAAGGVAAIIGLMIGCCKSRCRACERTRTERKWKKRMTPAETEKV